MKAITVSSFPPWYMLQLIYSQIATILAPLLALASPIEILHDLAERQSSCAPLELYHWESPLSVQQRIKTDRKPRREQLNLVVGSLAMH